LGEQVEGVHEKLRSQASDIVGIKATASEMRRDFDEFREEEREKARHRSGFKDDLSGMIAGAAAGATLAGIVQLVTSAVTRH
jgi:hypothetical protein